MLHSFGNTVLDMLLKDGFAHLIKGSAYRCNLRQHIIAVPSLFPQTLEAVGMTGDACKPFRDVYA